MDASGRRYELVDNLLELRAMLTFTPGAEVKAEFNEIKAGIAEEMRASEGFQSRELLEPANRKRLLLAFGIFLGQQSTGMTGTTTLDSKRPQTYMN